MTNRNTLGAFTGAVISLGAIASPASAQNRPVAQHSANASRMQAPPPASNNSSPVLPCGTLLVGGGVLAAGAYQAAKRKKSDVIRDLEDDAEQVREWNRFER